MATSVYGPRTLVAVKPTANASFKYGFYTNMEEAQRTVLGQIAAIANGSYIPGLVIGANAPKPAKAKKYRSGSYDTSFVDHAKIDDAITAGWKIVKRPQQRFPASSPRSKCVYITIQTLDDDGNPIGPVIKYAWNMRKSLYDIITSGDRTALGIQDAAAKEADLVFGARYPAVPRAKFVSVPTSGAITTKSTIIDPSKVDSLPTGWAVASNAGYE